MKMIDGLLAELEQEAETTRRVLERIPQAHLSWKPHPKSMSLGLIPSASGGPDVAWQVAESSGFAGPVIMCPFSLHDDNDAVHPVRRSQHCAAVGEPSTSNMSRKDIQSFVPGSWT